MKRKKSINTRPQSDYVSFFFFVLVNSDLWKFQLLKQWCLKHPLSFYKKREVSHQDVEIIFFNWIKSTDTSEKSYLINNNPTGNYIYSCYLCNYLNDLAKKLKMVKGHFSAFSVTKSGHTPHFWHFRSSFSAQCVVTLVWDCKKHFASHVFI